MKYLNKSIMQFSINIIIVFIMCLPISLYGEVRVNPDKIFTEATNTYNQGNYKKAKSLFKKAIDSGLSGTSLAQAQKQIIWCDKKLNFNAKAEGFFQDGLKLYNEDKDFKNAKQFVQRSIDSGLSGQKLDYAKKIIIKCDAILKLSNKDKKEILEKANFYLDLSLGKIEITKDVCYEWVWRKSECTVEQINELKRSNLENVKWLKENGGNYLVNTKLGRIADYEIDDSGTGVKIEIIYNNDGKTQYGWMELIKLKPADIWISKYTSGLSEHVYDFACDRLPSINKDTNKVIYCHL